MRHHLLLGLIAVLAMTPGQPRLLAETSLPRFTEEREAAALFFINKHAPEVLHVLELKADQLDKELGEAKDELARARDQVDKSAKARYDSLISQVRQRKK